MFYNVYFNVVFMVCYSGEIKFWSLIWELFLNSKIKVGEVYFVDWFKNGDWILFCGGEDFVVIVYDFVKCDLKWEI